jgi:beta-xylosidase
LTVFTSNFLQAPKPFPHFWEHTVGSGHASLALRADWQAQISADTETQVQNMPPGMMRDQAITARTEAGDLPLYYTEWNISSNPRDPLHDGPFAAAFVTKIIMKARGLVQGYSFWTFSDIFEENYFPSVPFHGGFGLLNLHGIAKPGLPGIPIAAPFRQ